MLKSIYDNVDEDSMDIISLLHYIALFVCYWGCSSWILFFM